ncbi:dipeptidase PepE [Mangrovimonas spongiae]|uniref:Dipeptidase PepE n=1 Tax=Mangrovimonas spongiae TaxID=2494697 RepID=A0A3R9MH31_9FLAO|nr:dipeptidase PepE [Mangrovimonas spongiae]RSK42009.1 dipeptidase PepE [Mangrovimonas spongiae]
MKHIILASTSTIHGSDYLDYILPELDIFFNDIEDIIFIPYARPGGITHNEYTKKAQEAFKKINRTIIGLHQFDNPVEAISNAKAIFTGGGNTFLLVQQLYKNNIITPLKNSILNGTKYFGTSAGSNIGGLTMNTTNDMPIVYPPSFKTLGLVSFNINPHYLDPLPNSKHMGETRETRLKEFHKFNTQPVVGLREGSWLEIADKTIILKGELQARIFEYNKPPYEVETGTNLSNLK